MIAASPPMLQSVRLWRSLKPMQVHPESDTHQISQKSSYPPWFSQRLCLDDGHCSEAYLFLIFIFSKMTPVVLNGKYYTKEIPISKQKNEDSLVIRDGTTDEREREGKGRE